MSDTAVRHHAICGTCPMPNCICSMAGAGSWKMGLDEVVPLMRNFFGTDAHDPRSRQPFSANAFTSPS